MQIETQISSSHWERNIKSWEYEKIFAILSSTNRLEITNQGQQNSVTRTKHMQGGKLY